tara:strand:- start:779 stop:1300 length:522 start_codon:yes stop_codon:yes gene_type:complete
MTFMSDVIHFLDSEVKNYREKHPGVGLPEDLFNCVTRMTPIMNVDLLLRDQNQRLLLAWRDDEFSGSGWHIPGGIVRFNETLHQRVNKVAEIELGVLYDEFWFESEPIAYNEVFLHRETRSHFFSILYDCTIDKEYTPPNSGLSPGVPGYLEWHETCPQNIVKVHEMYRKYMQ